MFGHTSDCIQMGKSFLLSDNENFARWTESDHPQRREDRISGVRGGGGRQRSDIMERRTITGIIVITGGHAGAGYSTPTSDTLFTNSYRENQNSGLRYRGLGLDDD